MKINSKSKDLNINNNYNKNMKSYLNFSLGLFLIIILSSGVLAGTLTVPNIDSNGAFRAGTNGNATHLNMSWYARLQAGEHNITNVTMYYRIGTSGAFVYTGNFTIGSTGQGGNLSHSNFTNIFMFPVFNLTNTRNLEFRIEGWSNFTNNTYSSFNKSITGIDIDFSAPNSTTLTLERDRVEILNPVEFSCSALEDIDTTLDLRTFLFKPDTTQLSSSSVNDTDNEVTSTFAGEEIDQRGEYSILCSSTNDANFTTNSSLISFNVLSENDGDFPVQPPTRNPIQISNAWLVFIIASVLIIIFVVVLIALTYSKKKR